MLLTFRVTTELYLQGIFLRKLLSIQIIAQGRVILHYTPKLSTGLITLTNAL